MPERERERENWGPAKHASFNELVTEAELSSTNTMNMCMHTHALAHTPIDLHIDTANTRVLSHPHAGMQEFVHAHAHTLIHTRTKPYRSYSALPDIQLSSFHTLQRGVASQYIIVSHITRKQHTYKNNVPLCNFVSFTRDLWSRVDSPLHEVIAIFHSVLGSISGHLQRWIMLMV